MNEDRFETANVIIKFGEEQHLREMRSRGVLHMRRLDYFKRQEDDQPLRFDAWEGR